MLTFVGLRFAALRQAISSNEVCRMAMVGQLIVRLPSIPLAICSAPPPQSPNFAHASSPSACYCASSTPSLVLEIAPSVSSAPTPSAALRNSPAPPNTLAPPTSTCPSALSLSAIPAQNCCPSLSSSPLGACHCAFESTYSLPKPTEADFNIFPKLLHEELKRPVRRYGAEIAAVEKKSTVVKIEDDDSPSGWECSLIEDYLLEGAEEKIEEDEENKDEEEWQMELLGIYVVEE